MQLGRIMRSPLGDWLGSVGDDRAGDGHVEVVSQLDVAAGAHWPGGAQEDMGVVARVAASLGSGVLPWYRACRPVRLTQ